VERLRGQSDPTPASIDDALSFAGRMREAKAGYFIANEHTGKRLDDMAAMSRNYLAHEYFNHYWSASYHSEVVAELSAAKLVFAAPSLLRQQMDQLMLLPQAREVLKDVTDPVARETIRDFFINTQFRRDLFVRGALKLSEAERQERLLKTYLVRTQRALSFPFKTTFPVGEVTIGENPGKAVLDAMADGPRTLGDVLGDPRVEAIGGNLTFQAIAILLAACAIAPALGPREETTRHKGAKRFNRFILSQNVARGEEQTMAAPVLGTGFTVPLIDQIFLLHMAEASPSVEALVQEISRRNLTFTANGHSAAPVRAWSDLEPKLAEFRRERLPIYRQLGIT
jgi:hypothetical protein